MDPVELLLRSPRALGFLAVMADEDEEMAGLPLSAHRLRDRGPRRIARPLLDSSVDLCASLMGVVNDWRWRPYLQGIDEVLLRDAELLRTAAEELVAAGSTRWWWRPLDPARQVWVHEAGSVPSEEEFYFNPDDWGGWPIKPVQSFWTSSSVAEFPSVFLFDGRDGLLHPPAALWRMPVRAGARVYEIGEPDDWRRLCEKYPRDSTERYQRWWRAWGVAGRRIITPDWGQVALDWDGVHLGFGGMLTTEGVPLRLAGGDGTLLEGWQYEQTCWFRWVFDRPERLPDWTGPLPA